MMSNANTLYSQLSPISFSDFTPSRVTRVSSNPHLQQHSLFSSDNLLQVRKTEGRSDNHCQFPLQGKYIQLDFSPEKASTETVEDFYSTIRKYSSAFCDRKPPFEVQEDDDDDEEYSPAFSHSYPGTRILQLSVNDSRGVDPLMDRPISFALAVGDNPILFDDDINPPTIPPKPAQAVHNVIPSSVNRNGGCYSETYTTGQTNTLVIDETELDNHTICTSDTAGFNSTTSVSMSPRFSEKAYIGKQYHTRHSPSSSPLLFNRTSNQRTSNGENLSEINLSLSKPLSHTRVFSSTPDLLNMYSDCPLKSSQDSIDMTNNDHQILTKSSSEESYGRYLINYLGSKDIDCYINYVNECAKKLIDPKAPGVSDSIMFDIKLKNLCLLHPRSGALLKSISMFDVFNFGQCTKNKRMLGILVWKRGTAIPSCHLFRCEEQPLSNAVLESLNSAKQDGEHRLMEDLHNHNGSWSSEPESSLLLSSSLASEFSEVDVLHKYPALHVASVSASRNQQVGSIINKTLKDFHPSESKSISIWLSPSQIKFVENAKNQEIIYMQHSIGMIQAIGGHHEDSRLIGYVIKEVGKPAMAYILWCYTNVEAVALVSFLRHACQLHYQERGEDGPIIFTDADKEITSSSNKKGFIARLLSLKPQKSTSSAFAGSPLQSPPSFHSYLGPQHKSTFKDVPLKRKNSVNVPTKMLSQDFTEEDYAKYSVIYVGSANMMAPFTPESITESLGKFKEGGVSAGMAANVKNSVTMHISALGINLVDNCKKQKMFVNRNYPQKQIIGHCMDPSDPTCFGFATFRPGYSDQVRVHVFRQLAEPSQQILDAMKFWLNLPLGINSGDDQVS